MTGYRWSAFTYLGLTIAFHAAEECHARDWALSIRHLNAPILPLQAARVCFVAANRGGAVRQPPATILGSLLSIKPARSGDWRTFKGSVIRPLCSADCSRLWAYDFETQQAIGPNQELSWSVAAAAEWGPKGFAPLFPRQGKYILRATWFPTDEPVADPIHADVDVVVATPQGDDEKVFRELQADPELVEVLLEPLAAPQFAVFEGIASPGHEVAGKLKKLIEQYPKSSYSDYARFALARYYLTSLKGLSYVKPANKVAATEVLEDIDCERFAYGDYVLSLWRRIQQSRHSREQTKIAEELDRLYPDSLIRLEDLAMRVGLDEWQRLNPRKPVDKR